jgi:hypothetical protein
MYDIAKNWRIILMIKIKVTIQSYTESKYSINLYMSRETLSFSQFVYHSLNKQNYLWRKTKLPQKEM